MLKRTPLFTAHQKLGAKLIDFGGWEMPVHYSTIRDEHLAVRRNAGLFDISHMGEIRVSGSGALPFLNNALTNDASLLKVGQAQYTLLCNPRGGVIDDLYLYRVAEEDYLLIVNASRVEADWDWLQSLYDQTQVRGAIDLRDESARWGAIAVQGPRVRDWVDHCIRDGSIGGTMVDRVTGLEKNELGVFVFRGNSIYVARTGYTGEDGFEVLAAADVIGSIWDQLLATGHQVCAQPAGLGARDTLRTEMGYPLYGHELDESTTPLEAGLGIFVALDKGPFIGGKALAEQKAGGVSRRCAAFRVPPKAAPPRPGYAIHAPGGEKIGAVVSGTQSPSLNVGIGMGYVPVSFAKPGTDIEIDVRGRRIPAEVVRKPIYRKQTAADAA